MEILSVAAGREGAPQDSRLLTRLSAVNILVPQGIADGTPRLHLFDTSAGWCARARNIQVNPAGEDNTEPEKLLSDHRSSPNIEPGSQPRDLERRTLRSGSSSTAPEL